MSARVGYELALLRRQWPDLEYLAADHWVRLPPQPVPSGWSHDAAEICFRIPADVATQPYGFYVKPILLLASNGTLRTPTNYTSPATTPFDGEWAMFSWSPLTWRPHAEVARGDNMVHFVRSFRDRLELYE